MFDIALREMEGESGLGRNDVVDLFDMLNQEEAYTIEIEAQDVESSAMGFITASAANSLDFDYTELKNFVANILDDMNNESEDCCYEFKGLRIWLSR